MNPDPITTAREAAQILCDCVPLTLNDKANPALEAIDAVIDLAEKLKAERDEALKKLEVAEQAVKRVQSASKAFEIAFTKTHAPDNETVRKAHIINATIDSEREMNAILTEELEDVKCRLSVAPILSKYHGRRGFETERFIADYEAWRSASQWVKDPQAKGEG